MTRAEWAYFLAPYPACKIHRCLIERRGSHPSLSPPARKMERRGSAAPPQQRECFTAPRLICYCCLCLCRSSLSTSRGLTIPQSRRAHRAVRGHIFPGAARTTAGPTDTEQMLKYGAPPPRLSTAPEAEQPVKKKAPRRTRDPRRHLRRPEIPPPLPAPPASLRATLAAVMKSVVMAVQRASARRSRKKCVEIP